MCDTYSWIEDKPVNKTYYFNTRQRKQIIKNHGFLKTFQKGRYVTLRINPDRHTHIAEFYNITNPYINQGEDVMGIPSLKSNRRIRPMTPNLIETWDIEWLLNTLSKSAASASTFADQLNWKISKLFIDNLKYLSKISNEKLAKVSGIINMMMPAVTNNRSISGCTPYGIDFSADLVYQRLVTLYIAVQFVTITPRSIINKTIRQLKTTESVKVFNYIAADTKISIDFPGILDIGSTLKYLRNFFGDIYVSKLMKANSKILGAYLITLQEDQAALDEAISNIPK